MNPIIIIPARMASTRLQGKPLADIDGTPMIVHVLHRAQEAEIGPCYIACAEKEIADAIKNAGGNAIMTNTNHPSGTDRIFEALQILDPEKKFDIIINVQGDLPTLDPHIIQAVLPPFDDPEVDIVTPVAKITDPAEEDDPHVVKAVTIWKNPDQGTAKAFTRSKIPAEDGKFYHHIGLYAYRRAALERFTSLPPSNNEQKEKLEQLRALDDGMRIDVVRVDTIPLGVDTPEDLEKARELIKNTTS